MLSSGEGRGNVLLPKTRLVMTCKMKIFISSYPIIYCNGELAISPFFNRGV